MSASTILRSFVRRSKVPLRDAGRRVLPVTLGPHHKPFESARTARGLRALDLVKAAPRNVARRAPWARARARKGRRSGSEKGDAPRRVRPEVKTKKRTRTTAETKNVN